MFSTRAVNHKINKLHERELKALLDGETSTFYDMLSKSNDTAVHVTKYSKIDDWILQISLGLSALIMKEVFTKRLLKYDLRNCRATFLSNLKLKNTVLIR